MYDLKSLDTAALIELLAQQTANYIGKIAERKNHLVELSKYEFDIAMIQSELKARKIMSENTSISDPTIQMQKD